MTIVSRLKSGYLSRVRSQKSYTVEEAKTKMERYCAYQERCHKEVSEKLRGMGMIPLAVDEIMGQLIQDNYLSETRFAQAFARGKFKIKHWGRRRITRELKARDISAYNIKLGLKEIPESDYLSSFHQLAEKRWEQLNGEKNQSYKKKKFVDYLMYRGWESNLIWDKLNELSP